MIPKFLRPETVPFASFEFIAAAAGLPIAPVSVIPATHCDCGVRLILHVDGWDGRRLNCAEAVRRNPERPTVTAVERTVEDAQRASFRALLANPTTGPRLDAMLADTGVVEAHAHDGPACGPSCFHGYITDPTIAAATLRKGSCPWCPDFDPTAQAPGLSHGMCADCLAEMHAEMDVDEGSRCGTACGGCGRCS